jgi:HNH endonuclease
MTITITCRVCGNPFSMKGTKAGNRETCSRLCKGIASRRSDVFSTDELRAVIEANAMPVPFAGCIVWLGAASDNGYGLIRLGRGRKGHVRGVHRVAYECEKGPIPDGLELDHLCRVRLCCNTAHLEPVTHSINTKRGLMPNILRQMASNKAHATHCRRGHAFDVGNTIITENGIRRCRICRNAAQRRSYAIRRQQIGQGVSP